MSATDQIKLKQPEIEYEQIDTSQEMVHSPQNNSQAMDELLDKFEQRGENEIKAPSNVKRNILLLSIAALFTGALLMIFLGIGSRKGKVSGPDHGVEIPDIEDHVWRSYVEADSYKEALERLGGEEKLAEHSERFPKMIHVRNYGVIYEGLFKPDLEMVRRSGLKIKDNDLTNLLMLRVYMHNDGQLQIKIVDPVNERYEIPEEYPYPFTYKETDEEIVVKNQAKMPMVDIKIDLRSDSFGIEVRRKGTDQVIFRINNDLIYSNLYIHYELELSSGQLYGLGQRSSNIQYGPGTYTLFSRHNTGFDTGKPGFNKHGHHPVYLNREEPSGKFNMVYLRNSNAQEFTITKDNKIRWRTIGGILDINLFVGGDNPEEIVEEYHRYVGGWVIPSLWHMGYHLSKWDGYMSVTAQENVLNNFEKNNIPLEVLWSDIEYFKQAGWNTILNEKKFPPNQMQNLFNKYNKRWIAIADAIVPMNENYKKEVREDYIDFTLNGNIPERKCEATYLGVKCYVLDFLSPKINEFWHTAFKQLYNKVKFSGLWIDANEITSDTPPDRISPPGFHNKYRDLPYTPGGKGLYDTIIVNPECVHSDGSEEYNVRPLNVIKQAESTHNFLTDKNHPFSFVLSRATAVGAAKFSFNWIADLGSNWGSMKPAFQTVVSMGLFGYSRSGTDICGFGGRSQAEPELCVRWHQLGMFHGFMRNHHTVGKDNYQEPYSFNGEYKEAIIRAIRLRYMLIKWMLSLYFEKPFIKNQASNFMEKGVGTVMKPLFYTFYKEKNMPAYGSDVYETQMMMGRGVMVAPVLAQGVTSQNVYFPAGIWTDLRNLDVIRSEGKAYKIESKIEQDTPYFLYEGNMMFFNEDQKALVAEKLNNGYKFVFSMGKNGESKGGFMNIADYSEENIKKKCVDDSCYVHFEAKYEKLEDGRGVLCFRFMDRKGENVQVDRDLMVTKIAVTTGYVDVREEGDLRVEKGDKEIEKYKLKLKSFADGARFELQGNENIPLYLFEGLCLSNSA